MLNIKIVFDSGTVRLLSASVYFIVLYRLLTEGMFANFPVAVPPVPEYPLLTNSQGDLLFELIPKSDPGYIPWRATRTILPTFGLPAIPVPEKSIVLGCVNPVAALVVSNVNVTVLRPFIWFEIEVVGNCLSIEFDDIGKEFMSFPVPKLEPNLSLINETNSSVFV